MSKTNILWFLVGAFYGTITSLLCTIFILGINPYDILHILGGIR